MTHAEIFNKCTDSLLNRKAAEWIMGWETCSWWGVLAYRDDYGHRKSSEEEWFPCTDEKDIKLMEEKIYDNSVFSSPYYNLLKQHKHTTIPKERLYLIFETCLTEHHWQALDNA